VPLSSLLALFGAGLLTFASPCVLPMLPVYLSVLGGAEAAGAEQHARRRLRLAGIGFAVGLSLVFIALGVGASALAGMLSEHRRAMLIVSGVLMALFGAKLLGLFRLGFLDREARPLLMRIPASGGFFGGLAFGAAFSLGWTPCVGPVLGAALTYSASTGAEPLTASVQLSAYALGLSLPLVAAAFAAERVLAWARRLRAVTPVLQKVTGAVLVAAGVLLATDRLGVLVPEIESDAAAQVEAPCEAPEGTACAAPTGNLVNGAGAEIPTGSPRLVEFMSSGCPACARMAPVLAQLEQTCVHEPDTIVRVNVDDAPGRALAARYGVRLLPTFMSVDAEGNEIERIVGEQPTARLAMAVGDVRGEACAGL